MVDALVKANDYLDIASHIEDPSQYWKVLRINFPNLVSLSVDSLILRMLCLKLFKCS